LKAPVHLFTGG